MFICVFFSIYTYYTKVAARNEKKRLIVRDKLLDTLVMLELP